MAKSALEQLPKIKQLLETDTLPISVLYFAAVAAVDFDLEVASMDPEAFLAEIESEINGQISDFARAKILAGQATYITDQIYTNLDAFINFANLTNVDDPPLPGVFNPANAMECALAVLEISLIDPDGLNLGKRDPQNPLGFSDEIRKYMGAVLHLEGAIHPVQPLVMAIMPPAEEYDDPNVFEAVASRTKSIAKAINHGVWEYAKVIFDSLVKIPTAEGGTVIKADQMKQLLIGLVGEFDLQ